MGLLNIVGLAGAMLLLAITPGPGVFATVGRALASGFKHAAVVVAGIVTGDLIFLLLALYGLSAMAESLGSIFTVVKYAGGAYLIWTGYLIWTTKSGGTEIKGVKELSWKCNFFSGLAITLGNPKVILFYLGFLPTFLDLTSFTTGDVAIIATVVSVIIGSVMLGYAYSAAKAKQLFKSEKPGSAMNRIAGGVMITTGTVLIAKV